MHIPRDQNFDFFFQSRHVASSSPTPAQRQQIQQRRQLTVSNGGGGGGAGGAGGAPTFLSSHRQRHALRPNTNLPFHDRGAPSDPDDFVSELRRSFLRPREEDLAGRPRAERMRTALRMEGEQTMQRLNL